MAMEVKEFDGGDDEQGGAQLRPVTIFFPPLAKNGHIPFVIALVADALLFGAFIGTYHFLKSAGKLHLDTSTPLEPRLMAWAGSFLLLATIAMGFVQRKLRLNQPQGVLGGLVISLSLLLCFMLASSVEEIRMLISAINTGEAAAKFYSLVFGLFGLHAIVAAGFQIKYIRRVYSWHRYTRSGNGLPHLAYFFYFLFTVWFTLFSLLYF